LLVSLAAAILVAGIVFIDMSAGSPRFTARTDLDMSPTANVLSTTGRSTGTAEVDAQQLANQAAFMTAHSTVAAAARAAGTQNQHVNASAAAAPTEGAIINLTVEADTKQAATRTANALAAQYIKDMGDRIKAETDSQIQTLAASDSQLQASLSDLAGQISAESQRLQAIGAGNSPLMISLQTRYNKLSDQYIQVQQAITNAQGLQASLATPARQLNEAWVTGTTKRGLTSRMSLATGAGLLAGLVVFWCTGLVARSFARGTDPRSHGAKLPGSNSVVA